MDELLEKTLMVEEGIGKSLATAAATGIIGGAAMLGGIHKAASEKPFEKSPEEPAITAAAEVSKAEPEAEKAETVDMLVTAYCPCAKCCGTGSPGITANGHKIQPGDHFVAADKRYPFGTELTIPGYNKGQPVKVLDRGGAIKGNRIDVFFPTHQEALQWGVQDLDVTVVSPLGEARGHWRNWEEEIYCPVCGFRWHAKTLRKDHPTALKNMRCPGYYDEGGYHECPGDLKKYDR